MTRYSIVGQRHIGLDPYLEGILPGTPVLLVREPTNGFDPNAIQVWIDGKRVGYLPKGDAAELAPIIDVGEITHTIAIPESSRADSFMGGGVCKIQEHKAMHATFARSPNYAYPQVEFELEPKA